MASTPHRPSTPPSTAQASPTTSGDATVEVHTKGTPIKGTVSDTSAHGIRDNTNSAYLTMRTELEGETRIGGGIKLDEWFCDDIFQGDTVPEMPEGIKPNVDLSHREKEMYPGLCILINDMLKKAGCNDLAAYSCDDHPQLADGSPKRNRYRPDIAIYPTSKEAAKAYQVVTQAAAKATSFTSDSASDVPVGTPSASIAVTVPGQALSDCQNLSAGSESARVATSPGCLVLDGAFVEVKKSHGPFSLTNISDPILPGQASRQARGQLIQYSREVFNHQHRVFVYSISIQRNQARFLRADRNGMLASEQFDYLQNPQPLWRFLYLFAKMSASQRGHDPSALLASEDETELFRGLWSTYPGIGKNQVLRQHLRNAASSGWRIYALHIQSKWSSPDEALDTTRTTKKSTVHRLLVGKPAVMTASLKGRGGKGFVAYDLEDKVVVWVKDAWRTIGKNISSEFDIYMRLLETRKDKFIPTLLAGGDVINSPCAAEAAAECEDQAEHTESESDQWQATITENWTKVGFQRRHYRLVIKEICRTLLEFQTLPELVGAMIGAITAHRVAWLAAGVLHRDISPSNILIYDHPGGGVVGLLADWDLAKLKSQLDSPTQESRSGTWQFLSIARQCTLSRTTPPALATFFYELFDRHDSIVRMWDTNPKFVQLSKGTPLIHGLPGGSQNPLTGLTVHLAELCRDHYNSTAMRRLRGINHPAPVDIHSLQDEPVYEDATLEYFSSPLPDKFKHPQVEGPQQIPEADDAVESPLETHEDFMNYFRLPLYIKEWPSFEKLADQVPERKLLQSALIGSKRGSDAEYSETGDTMLFNSSKEPRLDLESDATASRSRRASRNSRGGSRMPSPSPSSSERLGSRSRSGTPLPIVGPLSGLHIEDLSASRLAAAADGETERGRKRAEGKGKGVDRLSALRGGGE
ncbi:hypothetical protein ONZ51_g8074 [Trametes cubensis]|uniref:Fungal-type protein kinase domain-containing protein n=1 Tax=Trametes cubensis TaxID=1111947 RepID=A0AAD7TNY3_9APHY|nr:hypothetical protein ONZ51_g8074 [Trametes cubensis]